MRLVLKSYSQDVDIGNPDAAVYLLTFLEEESGKELRLPVQLDTVLKLVQETTSLNQKPVEKLESPQLEDTKLAVPPGPPEGASIFGDEEAEYGEEEDGVESL